MYKCHEVEMDDATGSGSGEPLMVFVDPERAKRKGTPVTTGCFDYFPDALLAISRHSLQANEVHNPGEPLHWSKEKSNDHADCIGRHLLERGATDPATGHSHSVALAWRALALLQIEIEEREACHDNSD